MDGGIAVAFTSLGLLVVVNIGVFAYGYGKLSQKVDDTARRLDRVEKLLNGIRGKDQ